MYKLLFAFCSLFFFACNSNTPAAPGASETASAGTSQSGNSAISDAEMSFLSPCVENAKASLDEKKAFTLCRCIFNQIQQKYPGADSATLLNHLTRDTAEVAQMAQACR